MEALITTTISAIIGVITGWVFARQSSRELKMEAAKLRRLNTILLNVMERTGWVKLLRDEQGEVTAQLVEASFNATIHTNGSVEAEVVTPPSGRQVKG